MKILVFGALNIDRVYQMREFVRPGETISAGNYSCVCGGKGFNLSVALANAGMEIYMAGGIGKDGDIFLDEMKKRGIHSELIYHSPMPCGHAVIQVNEEGENCIIIVGGANDDISEEYIEKVLGDFEKEDMIVLQNEIKNVPLILRAAHEKGMRVVWNPSPADRRMGEKEYACADMLFLNEVEAEVITGTGDVKKALDILEKRYPGQMVILTLGKKGALCRAADGKTYETAAYEVHAVDTTAAGDTFMGYFLAEYCRGKTILQALKTAVAAAAITVSRKGASVSIPQMKEVEEFMAGQ